MSHKGKLGTCCRATVGGGESLRVAVPRLTLTETSRSPCVFAQLHSVQPGENPCTSTFLSHFGWLLGVELLYNIYVKQLWLMPFTLLTSVHWGKPLHIHISLLSPLVSN
jgi:hypothetical protein